MRRAGGGGGGGMMVLGKGGAGWGWRVACLRQIDADCEARLDKNCAQSFILHCD